MAVGVSEELIKDSEDPQSTKKLIKEFCSYTTTHGVGRLAEAKTLFSRLHGVFSLWTHGLFAKYLSRPVFTSVKMRHKTHVTFPALTLCNQNTVKRSELEQNPSIVSGVLKEVNKRQEQGKKSQEASCNRKDNEDYSLEDGLEFFTLFQEVLMAELALEKYNTLYGLGHKFNEFVFECNFRGNDCRNYSKYWFSFWDYRYGIVLLLTEG
ncbi:ligand-gated sodium channel [Desmophyllum pertusum]|uniref:Ligand-gated sodium channel n=1 Tax=Desmophyllum pertusum TaxID=174260 RepID=A0A9W9YNA1_9CNID|nr:ligand-gated sodium channel [Desmophyllum pertusum]